MRLDLPPDRPGLPWLSILLYFAAPLAFVGWFFVAGEYWERLPLLERIAGPARFAAHVVDPVPETITDLRGGRSGFPYAHTLVRFRFSGEFATQSFLKHWNALRPEDARRMGRHVGDALLPERGWMRGDTFLLIDGDGRGVLYAAPF